MKLLHLLVAQMNNQFVGGGLVLMLTGSVIALLRQTPGKLIAWTKRRLTVEVEVLNSDPLFDYVTTWLDAQPYSKRSRQLTATTVTRISGGEESPAAEPARPRVFLSPAPGRHVFFYQRNLIWLHRTRDNAVTTTSDLKNSAPRKHESYSIIVLGKNQRALRSLIEEIIRFGSKPTSAIRLFNSSFGYWNASGIMHPRKLESVVLPEGVAESVLADSKRFLTSSDWYRSVGIPWHRGYLLYGLPGTGKTSLVSALAGELSMNLYLLNIGGCGINDDRLSSLMSNVRPGTIVLMEDIDCTAPNRESSEDRVTLSGLLNCLDGIQSREGCMIFMTTNFRHSLDSALTRPGRIDVQLEFGLATDDQIMRLCERLAPHRDPFDLLEQCRAKTMAEVQQILLADSTAFKAPSVFAANA